MTWKSSTNQQKILLVFGQGICQGGQDSFIVRWFGGLQQWQEILRHASKDGIQASQEI